METITMYRFYGQSPEDQSPQKTDFINSMPDFCCLEKYYDIYHAREPVILIFTGGKREYGKIITGGIMVFWNPEPG
jgi:hypothetical protein